MRKFDDKTGRTYGYLTVIRKIDVPKKTNQKWECLCKCGSIVVVTGSNLTGGSTKSCGCYRKYEMNIPKRIHNDRRNPNSPYKTWRSMKARCHNKNATRCERYGGRGIKVCDEWNDYVKFKEWALANGWTKGLTIDRIDNDGNYEPGNCRFISRIENAKKRRYDNMR
jgi:hypothetical protein